MAKIPTHVLRQLQTVLIPGMEMALQALVNELNQIRVATGQTAGYQIVIDGSLLGADMAEAPMNGNGTGTSTGTTMASLRISNKGRHTVSPEGKENMRRAQQARWQKQKKLGLKITDALPTEREASGEEILKWGAKHGGKLDKQAFKQNNPGVNMRVIGILVRQGKLVPTKDSGVYTAHNE